MNAENLTVLAKVIIAVETGGQVYGKGRYDAYAAPYTNTPNEHTITLGALQAFGDEAERLIKMILEADTAGFRKLDTCSPSIESMLSKNWYSIRWNPSSSQKKVLIALIDSKVGHDCQDKMMADKCKAMVAECEDLYPKADYKAQMMYAEIRHLGGIKAAKRIFDRLNGDYSLDNIMVSLVKDQQDTSSSNQVGDKIFWSRHLKCRQFIDEYSVDESKTEEKVVTKMAVIIGSARIDENGNATGGKAGDQKQTSMDDWKGEVSKQYWYKHSKGWRLLRAKDSNVREKIARNMEFGCSNKNLGYDQSANRSAYEYLKDKNFDLSKLDVPKETDCAQLVRLCVKYAGIDCGDFYTVTQRDVLMKTGKFEEYSDYNHTKISTKLLRGDILTTSPTKGHTVVVLTNGSDSDNERQKDEDAKKKQLVKDAQTHLNNFLSEFIKAKKFDPLVVDGEFGKKTMANFVRAFQHGMNLSYGLNLEVDGIYGRMSKAAAMNYPIRRGQTNYVVTVLEIGMMLRGIDPNGVECPGIFGSGLESAVRKCLGVTEVRQAEWTKLFTL